MDDRTRRHAEMLVDHCTEIGPSDDVLVRAPRAAEDLVVALYERIGERGGAALDRVTHNTLFGEKMSGTVHVAPGNTMAECVSERREFNDSVRHVNVLVDMRGESRIEVDGTVLQRKGTCRVEEGSGG